MNNKKKHDQLVTDNKIFEGLLKKAISNNPPLQKTKQKAIAIKSGGNNKKHK